MEMNEKITLTKIKQRGFSDKLISLLLPESELVDTQIIKYNGKNEEAED